MTILDLSKKTGDPIVVEYNGSPQTPGTPGTVSYSPGVAATVENVDIQRRQFDNDPTGLFNGLLLRQFGMSLNTVSGLVTLVFKDQAGVRHDWVEGSASVWEESGGDIVLKNQSFPVVLDQPLLPNGLMFKIVQGDGTIRNDQLYGVENEPARNDYELTFFNKTGRNLTSNSSIYTDVNGALHIDADIFQNGGAFETHAEQIYTKKDQIIMREGAVSGLAPTEYAGLRAVKYDGVNDGLLVWGADGYARVGDVGSLVILTGRDTDGNLTDQRLLYWDSSAKILKDSGIDFNDVITDTSDFISKTDVNPQSIVSDLNVGGIVEVGSDHTNAEPSRLYGTTDNDCFQSFNDNLNVRLGWVGYSGSPNLRLFNDKSNIIEIPQTLVVVGTTTTANATASGHAITKGQVDTGLALKEDSFSKNTAFNKSFGVLAGDVAEGNHTHTFAEIQSKPTTLSGYGITDSYTKFEANGLLANKISKTDISMQSIVSDIKIQGGLQVGFDQTSSEPSRLYGTSGTDCIQSFNDNLGRMGWVGYSGSPNLRLFNDKSNIIEIPQTLLVDGDTQTIGKTYSITDTHVLPNFNTTNLYDFSGWADGVYDVIVSHNGTNGTTSEYQAIRLLLVVGNSKKYDRSNTAVNDGHIFVILLSAPAGSIEVRATTTGNFTIQIDALKVA